MDKDKIIFELIQKVEQLTREVQYLRERLSKYETPKNSNNSSVPPSKDENRPKRNQSLRKKTGRNPGGQKGRKGNTLKMVKEPDFIEKHIPEYCSCCGKDIENSISKCDSFPFKDKKSRFFIFERKSLKLLHCGQKKL